MVKNGNKTKCQNTKLMRSRTFTHGSIPSTIRKMSIMRNKNCKKCLQKHN